MGLKNWLAKFGSPFQRHILHPVALCSHLTHRVLVPGQRKAAVVRLHGETKREKDNRFKSIVYTKSDHRDRSALLPGRKAGNQPTIPVEAGAG
jgi:hypothetical protein